MITQYHKDLLTEPVALWLGSASKDNIPDSIRATGVVVEDEHTLRCFFPEKFTEKFRSNILENPNVTVFLSHMYSFEGFQYKGKSTGKINPCTEEEIKVQEKYMNAVGDIMAGFGLDKQRAIDMYYYKPLFAVQIKVEHIFDQTPKASPAEK